MRSRKAQRREAAQKRLEKRQQRSPQEQLQLLDARLGKGKGAQKERARLMKLLTTKEEK